MNFNMTDYLNRHEAYLEQIFSRCQIPSLRLKEAMSYAVFPGGKRLRPLLVYLFGKCLNLELPCLDSIAAAIELTHSYSLVHDDLPAMDNDDLRRGKPSCHRAYDEATAILVGDALQSLAMEELLNELPCHLPSTQVIAVAKALLDASGVNGMLSGQCLELFVLAKQNIEEPQLRFIHALKTGQLILACANMPIEAANNPEPNHVEALRTYAKLLGLVFQMQDDYLDQYASQTHGKGRASDSVNQKTTFTSLYPQQELKKLIAEHYEEAIQALSCFGEQAKELITLTRSLQERGEE